MSAISLRAMRRVAVTGLGAVTPLGLDARSTWEAAVAGRSGVGFIESFDATGFPVRIAAEVKGFDAEGVVGKKDARRLERNVVLAVAAAREAWADAGVDGIDPARAGILVGSAIGGVMGVLAQNEVLEERGPGRVSPWFLPNVLVDSASGQVAIDLGLRGPNYAPVSACATGSHAVGEGAELIRRGDADVVLAGGTEACMHPVILAGFCAMRGLVAEEEDPTRASRPFDATRAGFVMGEGACVLALEELDQARARGARVYAEVLAYGTSNDAHHMAQPDPESVGVAEMMRAALEERGPRARAGRVHQRARDLDSSGRPRRDDGAKGRVRRPRVLARGVLDQVGHGSSLRGRGRGRGDDVRPRAARGRAAADDQLPHARPGARPRLRAERGAVSAGGGCALERDGTRRAQRLRAARAGARLSVRLLTPGRPRSTTRHPP